MTKKTKIIGFTGLGLSFALAAAGFTTSMVMIARDNNKKQEEAEEEKKQDAMRREQASYVMVTQMMLCEATTPEIYDWCNEKFKKPFDNCYNNEKISGSQCYYIAQLGTRCITISVTLQRRTTLTESIKSQMESIYQLGLAKLCLEGLKSLQITSIFNACAPFAIYANSNNAYYESMLKDFLIKNLDLIVKNNYKISHAFAYCCTSINNVCNNSNDNVETRLKAAIDAINSFGYPNMIKVDDPYKAELIHEVLDSMCDVLPDVTVENIPQVVNQAKETIEDIVKK